MPVIAIVGPPGVGKSYLVELFEDVVGYQVTVEQAPPLSASAEDAYRWGFSALNAIAIEHDEELHIFDGFPHPDYWAFWNTDFRMNLLQANLEKRMNSLGAKYVWVVPDSWDEYNFKNPYGSLMRSLYGQWIRNTSVGVKKVKTNDISVDLVNEICEDLGCLT